MKASYLDSQMVKHLALHLGLMMDMIWVLLIAHLIVPMMANMWVHLLVIHLDIVFELRWVHLIVLFMA